MESISSITAGHLKEGDKINSRGSRIFTKSNGERLMLIKHGKYEFDADDYLNLYKEVKDEFGVPRWEKAQTKVEIGGYKTICDLDYERKFNREKDVHFTRTIKKYDSAGNQISQMDLKPVSKYPSPKYTQFEKRVYQFFGDKFSGKLSLDVPSYFDKLKPMKILDGLGIKINSLEDLTPAIKRVLKLIK